TQIPSCSCSMATAPPSGRITETSCANGLRVRTVTPPSYSCAPSTECGSWWLPVAVAPSSCPPTGITGTAPAAGRSAVSVMSALLGVDDPQDVRGPLGRAQDHEGIAAPAEPLTGQQVLDLERLARTERIEIQVHGGVRVPVVGGQRDHQHRVRRAGAARGGVEVLGEDQHLLVVRLVEADRGEGLQRRVLAPDAVQRRQQRLEALSAREGPGVVAGLELVLLVVDLLLGAGPGHVLDQLVTAVDAPG